MASADLDVHFMSYDLLRYGSRRSIYQCLVMCRSRCSGLTLVASKADYISLGQFCINSIRIL